MLMELVFKYYLCIKVPNNEINTYLNTLLMDAHNFQIKGRQLNYSGDTIRAK